MTRLAEKAGRALLRAVSCLPFFLLALLARALRFILYRLLGYRVDVTKDNLRRSFPEKSHQEITLILRRFYLHLSEMVLEVVLYIGNRVRLRQRKRGACIINEDEALLQHYLTENQSIIVMMGHYGNWEWSALPLAQAGFRVLGIYKPQSSRLADNLMKWIREKPGILAVPMKETFRAVRTALVDGGPPFALILISDQIPAPGDIHFWARFLGRETAFFTGGGKLAKRFGLPVLYASQTKERFGRYRMHLKPLWHPGDPGDEEEITRAFIANLEGSVREVPHLWLWSHRRWKYRRENVPLNP
ncbi:MAG: lysophospholipid acyltransferase family protein [Bacteroidales bacterium]